MLEITERIPAPNTKPAIQCTLPFDLRKKGRFKTLTDCGKEIGFFLARGKTLKHGECVQTSNNETILILAAKENVMTVYCEDRWLFARACYHLGNRHVPLQITQNWLRFQADHVLEEMLEGFGLQAEYEIAEFEPEEGAYAGHAHASLLLAPA